MEGPEPKWVNPNDIWYGVNSLRLGGLHIIFKKLFFGQGKYFACDVPSQIFHRVIYATQWRCGYKRLLISTVEPKGLSLEGYNVSKLIQKRGLHSRGPYHLGHLGGDQCHCAGNSDILYFEGMGYLLSYIYNFK